MRQTASPHSRNDADPPDQSGTQPRRPSQSILRAGTSYYDSDNEIDAAPSATVPTVVKKRASFSQRGHEEIEFVPGSAPGGIIPMNSERKAQKRPSTRSSGGSKSSIAASSVASNISELSSFSLWSGRVSKLYCSCLGRNQQRGPIATYLINILCCPCKPPDRTLEIMNAILESWGYRLPYVFFTALLLFGESVRDLWCPKASDLVFDVLFVFNFFFFSLDCIMMCYVYSTYFTVQLCGRDYRQGAGPRPRSKSLIGGMLGRWGDSAFRIGSFMFWCDALSTLSLLYDISWINSMMNKRKTLSILLDDWGVPTEGSDHMNTSRLLERNLALVVAICRTARVARFMRATMTPQRFNCSLSRFRKNSGFDSSLDIPRHESEVGTAMRERTSKRVALGIILSLVIAVVFTYTEVDRTPAKTMVLLHRQTAISAFKQRSLNAAKLSVIPDLYKYADANKTNYTCDPIPCVEEKETRGVEETPNLREREILEILISPSNRTTENITTGYFNNRSQVRDIALIRLLTTLYMIFILLFGINSFAGPVTTLVVVPIEQMVRLLGMLMKDPLGYQNSSQYQSFVTEDNEFFEASRWEKDVLKGMETSFLMSTILRIGSLMKVGFGTAGVEIIRQSLEQQGQDPQEEDGIFLNSKGASVRCIFLFCDIRQFTDATESLQEEVFVFTNKIAFVIHSICNSYGGSANKNIGDAFLVSWALADECMDGVSRGNNARSSLSRQSSSKSSNHADKALLSVVTTLFALNHDEHYIESLGIEARDRLMQKIESRDGPVVQMGFGLHLGKAVQGAIGSQRKLDATYVSEAVEFSEFLESSTKQYGVKMLMSDAFFDALSPSIGRECRQVDQLICQNEGEDYIDDSELLETGEKILLYTYDMDMEALWRDQDRDGGDTPSTSPSKAHRRTNALSNKSGSSFHKSIFRTSKGASAEDGASSAEAIVRNYGELNDRGMPSTMPPLVLPQANAMYTHLLWGTHDIKKVRKRFSDGFVRQKFSEGLIAYYERDWERAKDCFQTILDQVEDGPSHYFMKQMEASGGVPPRNFLPYGRG